MTDQPQNFRIQIDPTWEHYSLWEHPLGTFIDVTYWDTDGGISDSASPNYADTDVVGRGELYKNWISTGNKEIQVTLQFQVQGTGEEAIRREVLYPARFIDKLKYPVYDAGSDLTYRTPTVLVRIGSFLMIRAIVTDATINWKAPFEPDTLLPHAAEVPVTFAIVRAIDRDMTYRPESITDGQWR